VDKKSLICKYLTIGIILLFVGTCIISISAQDTEKTLPASRGNTLYVGGNGPGNYTRIQDAIDNASGETTVFVYPGSYEEDIAIPSFVHVLGYEKQSTILKGDQSEYVVKFNVGTKNASIACFTIENIEANTSYNGIFIPAYCENITISDNILTQQGWREGIFIWSSSKVTVTGNTISHKQTGVSVDCSEECTITDNIISDMDTGPYSDGIALIHADKTLVSGNILHRNNQCGIRVDISSSRAVIKGNDIQENGYGICLFNSGNVIARNNILENNVTYGNARFGLWIGNYWGPLSRPKVVQLIHGQYINIDYGVLIRSSLWFDLFPAEAPYDIHGSLRR
jgi:parallel beta-helix repeat protein